MKFLVLGCNGMAGHMISLYLKERGHDVLGVALTKSPLVNSSDWLYRSNVDWSDNTSACYDNGSGSKGEGTRIIQHSTRHQYIQV